MNLEWFFVVAIKFLPCFGTCFAASIGFGGGSGSSVTRQIRSHVGKRVVISKVLQTVHVARYGALGARPSS